MPAQPTETPLPELTRVLEDIRRLLIFALLRGAASQDEIADALGVNQSTISRMFPKKDHAKKGLGQTAKKVRKGVQAKTGKDAATRGERRGGGR